MAQLKLQQFFPYRLSILSDEVSRSVAQVYAERFSLTRQQWRVLAVLAEQESLTATDIAGLTRLDKMQVSRAVGQLDSAGHVVREPDPADKRHQRLRLTPEGRRLYEAVAPRVSARETFILSSLSAEERRSLDAIMAKLLERSRELQACG